MSAVFLSLHVVLAILAIGPIAVAASIFPRYARAAATTTDIRSRATTDSGRATASTWSKLACAGSNIHSIMAEGYDIDSVQPVRVRMVLLVRRW